MLSVIEEFHCINLNKLWVLIPLTPRRVNMQSYQWHAAATKHVSAGEYQGTLAPQQVDQEEAWV